MSNFGIGIRKYVELGTVQYWLLINAKEAKMDTDTMVAKAKVNKKWFHSITYKYIHNSYWKVFILFTIMLNTLISVNFFHHHHIPYFIVTVVIVHLTCFFFWIDFLGAVSEKIIEKKKKTGVKTRGYVFLTIEAISLLPFSLVYVIMVKPPEQTTFWWLRSVTLLRFYRIPHFLSKLATAGRNHWKIFMAAYIFYLALFIDAFANFFLSLIPLDRDISVANWNETAANELITFLYFSCVTVLNVGFGDIVPFTYFEMMTCTLAAIFGCSMVTGVLTGSLATEFSNREKRREIFRQEYEATMNTLRERKIDKKILEKTSENFLALWKYKRGYMRPPPVHILPMSILKEMYFDVNFELLNRSVIFSVQPRSFLRSVSILMRNVSYLPGETIMEPIGIIEAMIFVASGVIEVLSEENDETPLFSLTKGSIIGEAGLFVSIPVRCVVRASTYVEIQLLKKMHFTRLGLKYPEIHRAMQREIHQRFEYREDLDNRVLQENLEDFTRRRGTKRFLDDLRRRRKDWERGILTLEKRTVYDLYVISDNIPRVKTMPLNLIKSKPWILRPNTTLTEFWESFVVAVVLFGAYFYPYLAAFVREINDTVYVILIFTDAVYIIDLYIQCTTAIERKDHFTYVTSIRKIIGLKLRTVGFYLDVLSTYTLSVYAELVWPKHSHYAYLILSLNKLLKSWHIPRFFRKLENDLNRNFLFIISIKYFFYFSIGLFWSAAILYLEACPSVYCYPERWYEKSKKAEYEISDLTPCVDSPAIFSLYFACMSLSSVGYGDVSAGAISDCLAIIVIITVGTCLSSLCVSETSAAVKYLSRIRTDYQEEVFAVDRFMREHELSKELLQKVRDYFQLQWNYDKGFIMQQTTSTEKLSRQQKQIILTELVNIFMKVPLFQGTHVDFLTLLAKLCRIRVLPPNETICEATSYYREIYILENGYCEVSRLGEDDVTREEKVIGPINCMGFLEMVLGVPWGITVRTLTHVRMIGLDYPSYWRAATQYPTMKAQIDDMVKREYGKGNTSFDRLVSEPAPDPQMENPDKILQEVIFSKSIINVYKYHTRISKNYWEPFRAWGKFRFLQFLLTPFVIVPHSLFIKIWMTIRITCVLIIGILAPIHFSIPNQTQVLFIVIMILQSFTWVDMYLMFHVAYYDKRGILMFHPAKTATWYLTGNFVLDLITVFPMHLVINAAFSRDDDAPNLFFDAPGLIMVFQMYKFFQGCHYLEKDIRRRREVIKIIKFLPVTVIITNFITGIMILLECHSFNEGDRGVITAGNEGEYIKSIREFCSANVSTSTDAELGVFRWYLMTYYWVTATTTLCGFGDLNAHNKATMIAVMLMILFGIVLYTYMFASLTSSMISVHNQITKHRRRVKEMIRFMKDKDVDQDIQGKFILHYEYNWQRTEGRNPQEMFTYVYDALRENIMASMYEATLRLVPAFLGVEKSVLRVIGKYLDEIYFLRGETIVRYNDIQEYIYLIYRGKVEVTSKTGRYVTTMGKGGLFGNISKKPFSLSSVIVVATKNVDIIRLHSKNFFKALQGIPNTKSLIEYLMSQKVDYLEPLESVSEQQSSSQLNLGQMETLPYEMTSTHMIKSKMKFSTADTYPSHRFFHAKNSTFKVPGGRCHTFVILPDSWLDRAISICYFLLAYLSATLTAYMFAFQDCGLHNLILSYIIDFLFFIKIGLQFNISHYDKYGDYVVSRAKIKRRYLESKKTLCYDIITNLPLEVFALVSPKPLILPVLTILRLNRTLRLVYIFEFFEAKGKVLMINKIHLQLSWITVIISLMVHFFACIWYLSVCPLNHCQNLSWVVQMSLEKDTKFELYLGSVYYVVILITTTGYGDVLTLSVEGMMASILFMILSRFGVALLAGATAAITNVHSIHLFLFQERIAELKASFYRQNISEYQIFKMWNYVTKLWLHETGKQIPKFINSAPYSMKCEVMYAMFGSHLSQCYVFAQLDNAFLRQLAVYLQRFVYFPGNYIVQQRDIDQTMYFIHKGQVSVLTIHPDLMETIHFTLQENDHFGMEQGLTMGKEHHFSYRAETDVEILSLTLSHWQHLLKYFPDTWQKINKKIESLPKSDDVAQSVLPGRS